MRLAKEIYLPLLEIFISLALGFSFFFSLDVSAHTPIKTKWLVFPYPPLLLASVFSLFLGYLANAIYPCHKRKSIDWVVLSLLVVSTIPLVINYNRPFLFESIFHQEEIFIYFSALFLVVGYISFSLREARAGGFLLGVFFYSVFPVLENFQSVNYKGALLVLACLGVVSLFFRRVLTLPNQFLPRRSGKRDFKLFGGIYSSFLVLFILHTCLSTVRGFSEIHLSMFLFLFSFLVMRGFAVYKLNESHFRHSVIYGRNLVVANFILFAGSFSLDSFGLVLFFSLGGCLGFFRPQKENYKKRISTLLLGVMAFIFCLVIIQISKNYLYAIYSLGLLVFLVFYPFLQSAKMDPLSKHIPLATAFFLSVFLFKVPTIYTIQETGDVNNSVGSPIPYLLTNLWVLDDNYIYVQSGLPQDTGKDFPNLDELKGKIPILGYEKDNLYLKYYRKHLLDNGIPFYVIYPGNVSNSELNKKLKEKKFPGFFIYYSENSQEPDWNQDFPRDGRFRYIREKVESLDNWKEIPTLFRKLEPYASYEIRREILRFRTIISNSINSYCKYYSKSSMYPETLNCYKLEWEFGKLDNDSIHNAYDTLNYTTPGVDHIPLLETLGEVPQYKISIYKKIYPIYISMNRYSDAIAILEKLMDLAEKAGSVEDRKIFELEWVRSLIESDKLEKAYPTITSALRKDPDSLLWNRLMKDYEEKREARRRMWLPPPSIDTTDID